jgi:hypothetical protein
MKKIGRKYYNDAGEQVCPECGVVIKNPHCNQIYCRTKTQKYIYKGVQKLSPECLRHLPKRMLGVAKSSCLIKAEGRIAYSKNSQNEEYMEKSRIKSRENSRKLAQKRTNMGMCIACGKYPQRDGLATCVWCREKMLLRQSGR